MSRLNTKNAITVTAYQTFRKNAPQTATLTIRKPHQITQTRKLCAGKNKHAPTISLLSKLQPISRLIN